MSESLRNDGRIWVPKEAGDDRPANEIPEDERDYFLERRYPTFGNLVPRDVASRNAKNMVDKGKGIGPLKNGVYLDFATAIERLGADTVEERYSNLFEMYERITDENPYKVPMRIYPAAHYTMGGLWVDYHLMTSVPGMYAIGEANFSDHGANRLGASALMQGLADGYFVLPYTIGDYLSGMLGDPVVPTDDAAFVEVEQDVKDQIAFWMNARGTRSPDYYHRQLGKIMVDYCGMERTKEGLEKAIAEIPALHAEFRQNVRVLGSSDDFNETLEKVQRVDDFFELALLMCIDALSREESCGGHFRTESQTEEGEALRNDDDFAFSSAWEWTGRPGDPKLHKEHLEFNHVKLSQRSYK
jgi:succinate dehydrogenase / fumarate reductase flavoprotein subunit